MPVIVAGIGVAIVISLGIGYLLYASERPPVYRTAAAPSVRIDHPGDNLVGPDWSGLYKTPPQASEERQTASKED